jgi:hypothetical protein
MHFVSRASAADALALTPPPTKERITWPNYPTYSKMINKVKWPWPSAADGKKKRILNVKLMNLFYRQRVNVTLKYSDVILKKWFMQGKCKKVLVSRNFKIKRIKFK